SDQTATNRPSLPRGASPGCRNTLRRLLLAFLVELWHGQTYNAQPQRIESHPMAPLPALPHPEIGIITPLPKEYAAMQTALPKGRDVPVKTGRRDSCSCYLSTIRTNHGDSLPVALFLSGMGNNIAGTRASQLLASFNSISHIIMTGIAGGIPTPA